MTGPVSDTASAPGEILASTRDGVATVTLNRPASLNALTLSMFEALGTWLDAWRNDPTVQVVAFRGAGGKAFCAGGDVRQVRELHLAGELVHDTYFAHEYAVDFAVHDFPKPTVSILDGITMGGGMGIAQGTSLRIVTRRSKLAMPETAIGLFPDVGATWFLPRCPGRVGLYLGLTGTTIGPGDALYAGLADVFLDDESLAKLGHTLAGAAKAAAPREALASAVRSLASAAPHGELHSLRPAIDRHFGADSVEAILASLSTETDPAVADWAARTRETMLKRSPTSLRVTFEQLRRGRSISLADAFRLELGMVCAAFEHGDVVEGVRAVLVDKDHRPQWRPSSLTDVTAASVQAFFRPRWASNDHPLRHLGSGA